MLSVANLREAAILEDAFVNPEKGLEVNLRLLIGNEEYTERIDFEEGGDWGQSEVAMGLQLGLADFLPRRLLGAPVQLWAGVEGVLVPQFTGFDSKHKIEGETTEAQSGGQATGEPDGRSLTVLTARSAGALLDKVPLAADRSYPGLPPEAVVFDAVLGLPYDDRAISVQSVGTPTLYFVDDEAFKAYVDTRGDILGRVQEQVLYSFRDTAYNGFVASVDSPVAKGEDVTRIYASRELPFWVPPERIDELYSGVRVFYEPEGGQGDPDAYSVFQEVVYRGLDYQPFFGVVLTVPFSDASAAGPAAAAELAYLLADSLSRGLYRQKDMYLPSYYPLVEKGDVLRLYAEESDDDGSWDREYLARVDAFKHPLGAEEGKFVTLDTQVSYTAVMAAEELIRVPALIVSRGLSGGVAATPLTPLGNDLKGFWAEPKGAVTPAGEPWVWLDAMGFAVDPILANGHAGTDAAGFWVDIFLGDVGLRPATGFWMDPAVTVNSSGAYWLGTDGAGFWIDEALGEGRGGIDAGGAWLNLEFSTH